METEGLKMDHSSHIDPYRRVCSIATIQSDQKGFFSNIIAQLKGSGNYENALLKISSINDNLEIMKYISTIEELGFSPKPIFKGKNEEEAIKQRLLGNEAFQRKDYQKAFLFYSISVMKAEYPTGKKGSITTLGFALGNRSACLLNLGHYKEAACDINLALSLGYPKDGRYKLYERLARIYQKMGFITRAKTSCTIAKQLLTSSKLDDVKKEEFENSISKLLKECESAKDNPSQQIERAEHNLNECNKQYPSLSSKAIISTRPNYGRYVQADGNVAAGETVLVEEPYAAVLYPEKIGLHCAHCFDRLKASIPCPKCSGIAFCSMVCRDEALETYHRHECQYQDLLSGLGCSQVVRLAFRMVTQNPPEYFLSRKTQILKLGDETEAPETSLDPCLRSLALVGLNSQRWPEDQLLRGVMAFVLVAILRASGYFGDAKESTTGASLTPNELFVASVILRATQVLQFNAHEVYQVLRMKEDSIKPCKNVSLGLAIYPTASYFNHSCHGDVARFFKGKKLHIKSLHSIKGGDEICENYGPTFYIKPREGRKAELAGRYWFKCSCKPCTSNWQTLDKLSQQSSTEEELKKADQFMSSGNVVDAITTLSAIMETHVKSNLPSQEVIKAEDKLRTCIANLGSVSLAEKKA